MFIIYYFVRNLFDVHEELVRRAEQHNVDESSRKSFVSKLAANAYTFGKLSFDYMCV